MTRIGLIVLTCLFVAVGCSDDDVGSNDDDGDAGHSTEDTGADDDTGDVSQDVGDASRDAADAGTDVDDTGASQDTDVPDDAGSSNGGEVDEDTVETAGDFIRTFVDAGGRPFRYSCECWWEASGYDDEQECLDDSDYVVPDDEIEDAAQCFEDVVEDHGEPAPQSALATLECHIDAATDYEKCEEDLRDEYDDICEDSAAQSLEECDDEWYYAFSEGCDLLDDEGEDWLDDVFDAAGDEDCLVGISQL